MAFLPDVRHKKDPPANFFWRLCSAVCATEFKEKRLLIKARMMEKTRKPATIKVTPEAKALMGVQRETTLDLLNEMRKPRLGLQGSYLRRAIAKWAKEATAAQGPRTFFSTPAQQAQEKS